MIAPMLSSLLAGAGLWCLARAVRLPPVDLAAALGTLQQPASTQPVVRSRRSSVVGWLTPSNRRLASDLGVMGRTEEMQVMHRLRTGGFWSAAAVLVWAAPLAAGARPLTTPLMLVVGVVIAAAFGWWTTDRQLRTAAVARRREFDGVTVIWLGLVTILIAGGAGIEQALTDAADHGHGWGFTLLRQTLRTAAVTNQNPWDQLAATAEELELETLADVAASMQLAGTTGAHIRNSLQVKARAIRQRQIAVIERDANTRTTAMAGPTGLMVLGFVTLLLYPAITAVAAL